LKRSDKFGEDAQRIKNIGKCLEAISQVENLSTKKRFACKIC